MHLTNTDYWLRLGKDICFNLHFATIQFNRSLCADFPAPTALPMLAEHGLLLRPPNSLTSNCSVQDADAAYCQTLLSTIIDSDGTSLTHLSHILVQLGGFNTDMLQQITNPMFGPADPAFQLGSLGVGICLN
jgi:hypothetical protein